VAVSEDTPERPGGTAAFMRAVNVTRNAKVGFAIGILLSVALLGLVVRGAAAGSQYPVYLYAALAFVLAVGTGLLLTAVFTVGSVIRRVRELE
jgi:hypothetical protein